MYPFETILVPVDFSEPSRKALDLAIKIAKQHSARIELVHSFPSVLPPLSPYDTVYPVNFAAECREAGEAKLAEWCGFVRSEGVEVGSVASQQMAAEAINDRASEVAADLIVMGTRGLSGLKHMLLGSVTERTLRTASCPVLTVREAS